MLKTEALVAGIQSDCDRLTSASVFKIEQNLSSETLIQKLFFLDNEN